MPGYPNWKGGRSGHRPERHPSKRGKQKAARAGRSVDGMPAGLSDKEQEAFRAYWRWMLTAGTGERDPGKPGYGATTKQFKEGFQVRTTEGKFVRFRERPKQAYRRELRDQAWAEGRVFRSVTLKTRRYGVTTDELLSSIERLVRSAGWRGSTIAKNEKDFGVFRSMMRQFWNQIPKFALAERGIEIVSNTDTTIVLKHGQYRESSLTLFSANTQGIGRGDGVNKLHPTEMPYYKPSAQQDYYGAQPGLGKHAGCEEPWESTAQGFDAMLYSKWQVAHWPGEQSKGSDFVRVFIAAFEHPDAYRPFGSDEEMEEFAADVGGDPRYGGEMEQVYYDLIYDWQLKLPDLLDHYDCHECWSFPVEHGEGEARRRTLEQLHYFRVIQNDDCDRDFKKRQSDFPMTAKEAFVSTGSPFFDAALVEAWHEPSREDMLDRRLTVRGNLNYTAGTVKWYPTPDGIWRMRQDRETGMPYAGGADTASGKKKHADGKTEADFPVAYIGNVVNGFVCAYLREHIPPRQFAWEIAKASFYYGKAPFLIERAATGDVGTTIAKLEEMTIGTWDVSECLLKAYKVVSSDEQRTMETFVGHRTKRDTKRPLVELAREALVDFGPPRRYEGAAVRPPWPFPFIEQARYFEQQENGSLEATEGHDDDVIAFSLFQFACDLVRMDPDVLMTKVVSTERVVDLETAALMQQRLDLEEADPVWNEHLGVGF